MHNTVSLRKKRIQLLSTFGKQDQLRSKGLQKKTGKFVWKKKVRTQIASGGIMSKAKKRYLRRKRQNGKKEEPQLAELTKRNFRKNFEEKLKTKVQKTCGINGL